MDWSVSLGIFGDEAKRVLRPKIEEVLVKAHKKEKILAMGGSSPEQIAHYRNLGVRLFFVGVDVNLKRKILADSLSTFRESVG